MISALHVSYINCIKFNKQISFFANYVAKMVRKDYFKKRFIPSLNSTLIFPPDRTKLKLGNDQNTQVRKHDWLLKSYWKDFDTKKLNINNGNKNTWNMLVVWNMATLSQNNNVEHSLLMEYYFLRIMLGIQCNTKTNFCVECRSNNSFISLLIPKKLKELLWETKRIDLCYHMVKFHLNIYM